MIDTPQLENLILHYHQSPSFLSLLEKTGASKVLIENFIEEDSISIRYLQKLVDSCPPNLLASTLRRFLNTRWAFISNTDLGYVSLPHSPMNLLCQEIAKLIAGPDEHVFQVIMPTLEHTDYLLASEDIDDYKSLVPLLISDDNKAMIHIGPWFEMQATQQSQYFNHLYSLNDQTVPLTDNEIQRLERSAMPASTDFFDEFDFRIQLLSRKGTLAEAVVKLCDGLKANGQGSKRGTSAKAHTDVFTPIHEFALVLEKLTPAQRESVYNLTINGESFQQHWMILSGYGYTDNLAQWRLRSNGPCVEESAAIFLNFLKYYPDFFSSIIIEPSQAQGNTHERTVTPFSGLLARVQAKILSRETALKVYLETQDTVAGQDAIHYHHPSPDTPQIRLKDLSAYDACLFNPNRRQSLLYFFSDYSFLYKAMNARQYDIAALLIQAGADLSETYGRHSQSILNFSIEKNIQSVFNAILSRADVNLNDPSGQRHSAIHTAAIHGRTDFFRALVAQGADISQPSSTGRTALHYAADAGALDIMEIVLKEGLNINQQDAQGLSALHYATENNDIETAGFILSQEHINVAQRSDNDETPLCLSLSHKHDEISKMLILAGMSSPLLTLEALQGRGIVFTVAELVPRSRCLFNLSRIMHFEDLCVITNIAPSSSEALILHAACVISKLPANSSQALAIEEALLSTNQQKILNALEAPHTSSYSWNNPAFTQPLPPPLNALIKSRHFVTPQSMA